MLFGGKKKKDNTMIIFIVILLCCCCYCCSISSSIGGYFMMNKSQSPDNTTTDTPSPDNTTTDTPSPKKTLPEICKTWNDATWFKNSPDCSLPENKDKYFKNCNGLDQCKNGTLTSIKSRPAVGDTSHSNVKYSSDALAAAAEPDSVLGQCYRPTNKYIGPEPSCWGGTNTGNFKVIDT